MVRLVFRPYTQVKRTICTSVSLRASTRVSPGFTLLRHSSPSFGSQQICSYSNLSQAIDRSMMPPGALQTPRFSPHLPQLTDFTFIAHQGIHTQILAYMLDSLVRVSRRDNENHFVSIANLLPTASRPVNTGIPRTHDFAIRTRTAPRAKSNRKGPKPPRRLTEPQSSPQ